VAAIDVGGTEIKAALISSEARFLAERRVATPSQGPDVAEQVVAAVGRLASDLEEAGGAPVRALGVVVPGIVDETTGIGVYAQNLHWRDVPFRDRISVHTGLPTAFGHDVRAGGLAEATLGAARGRDNVLFLPLGTGIACALVLDGRPHSAGGYGGEIGHVDVGHGLPCACGLTGCLEAVASAAAISRRYAQRTGGGTTEAAEIAQLVADGDRDAQAVWDDAVDGLATALAWSASVLAPEIIVIGGGLSRAGELLFEPLRAQLATKLSFQRMPELVPAQLGDQAGCLGAGLLALALPLD
jgi:glucokinase